MTSSEERTFRISSEKLIPLGFLVLILIGTLLLWLPVSTAPGKSTGFLTALFTSTTSTCVTGLVVVDTFSHWSLFGKIVILVLIQFGGLGVIAVASAVLLALKKKLSFREGLLLRDAFNLDSGAGFVRFLVRVLSGTFLVEFLGFLLYLPSFIPKFGVLKGAWVALFTSVSAFCNAGIDVIGPDSLVGFQEDPLVLIVTMMLIVLGGLGYVVWFDLLSGVSDSLKKKRPFLSFFKRLSEHTKVVLVITAVLIFGGALLVFFLESGNSGTIGNLPFGAKVLNSLFQSVTFRTAGFASVPQQHLTHGTCILGLFFMFVGGSPVGTAGGVKTVTFALLLLNVFSFIRGRRETVAFRRSVPDALIRKATAIITVSLTVTLVMTVLLAATNGLGAMNAAYEVTSATATVGLSRAVTPGLNTVGRLIIIFCMFFGRIGPISMALFFTSGSSDKKQVRYANGSYFVG